MPFHLFLLFYNAFVTPDVLFTNTMLPFAYAVDYFPKIVLEFLVAYVAGAVDFVHDISFASARSYRNQNVILHHAWSHSILATGIDLRSLQKRLAPESLDARLYVRERH
jgi:hypothetical protein